MRVLLFDLYGLFMQLQSETEKAKVEAAFGVTDFQNEFWRKYREIRHPLDAGTWNYQQYFARLRDELKVELEDANVAEFLQADWESWSHADSEMVSWLSVLREIVAQEQNLELALLSNIPTELLSRLRQTHSWIEKFPRAYFSCELGLAKPDSAIYQAVATDLGVDFSDILFFDDTYENIVAAQNLGMQTYHFTGITKAQQAVAEFLAAR